MWVVCDEEGGVTNMLGSEDVECECECVDDTEERRAASLAVSVGDRCGVTVGAEMGAVRAMPVYADCEILSSSSIG